MKDLRRSIFWENNLIGWIENSKVDNAFLYGKWVPCPSDFLLSFLRKCEAIESGEVEEEVWVSIDSPDDLVGTIERIPGEEVEIIMRRSPSR